MEIAEEYTLQRMVTLTLDPKIIPARYRGRTDRYIRELWRMMRVLLMRKFGKTLPFVGVLEFQKNGNAHLHLLVGQYIPQAWLTYAWQSIGGGIFASWTCTVSPHTYRSIWLATKSNTRSGCFPAVRESSLPRGASCCGAKKKKAVGDCAAWTSAFSSTR